MNRSYNGPLYLLAFDHRGSFARDLFRASEPLDESVRAGIVDAKQLIFEGFLRAVERGAPRQAAGVLVDEEFGADVARRARADRFVLAMPVERSGRAEFEFEFGEGFGAHVESFDPSFAKVLVRYNPEGDDELNKRQTERLAKLGAWLAERQRMFLIELLVPATAEQLAPLAGDHDRYDRELRPHLVVEAIGCLQNGGVEPDIWKVEGLDAHDACVRVVRQATVDGRTGVKCIVLGRGANESKVLEWLRVAAAVPGYDGFAVGRTIWEQPLQHFLSGSTPRAATADEIADRYLEAIDGYARA